MKKNRGKKTGGRPSRKGGGKLRVRRAPRPRVTAGQRRRAHALLAAAPELAATADSAELRAVLHPDAAPGVRLNRWLAERGVASRRKCDELIQRGTVEINGTTVRELGRRVQPGDQVKVGGAPVPEVRRLYYLFHKPKGVVCTEDPRENRPRVCDLVAPWVAGRVYTVGRLDEESEGLLLLTNDGDFANLVAHPRYGVPKTYVVKVRGAVGAEMLRKLRAGVHLAEGKAVPLSVRVARRGPESTLLEVRLREGRNREIRRLCARLGLAVSGLKRVRIGELGMTGLSRGALRPLTKRERDALIATALGERSAGREA